MDSMKAMAINHYSSRVTLRYIGVTKTEIEKMYFEHSVDIV